MGNLWVEEIRVYGANRRYTPVIFVLWDEKTIIFEKKMCIYPEDGGRCVSVGFGGRIEYCRVVLDNLATFGIR